MSIHTVTIGDTGTKLTVTLYDANRAQVDPTGGTLTFRANINGTAIEKSMSIVSEKGEYEWLSDDFTGWTAGDWPLQFKLVKGGKTYHFPSAKDGSTNAEIYDILRVRAAV